MAQILVQGDDGQVELIIGIDNCKEDGGGSSPPAGDYVFDGGDIHYDRSTTRAAMGREIIIALDNLRARELEVKPEVCGGCGQPIKKHPITVE